MSSLLSCPNVSTCGARLTTMSISGHERPCQTRQSPSSLNMLCHVILISRERLGREISVAGSYVAGCTTPSQRGRPKSRYVVLTLCEIDVRAHRGTIVRPNVKCSMLCVRERGWPRKSWSLQFCTSQSSDCTNCRTIGHTEARTLTRTTYNLS